MERCAVIGSGLGGLTAAHILSQKYKVTILEKAESIGMDVASVSVYDDQSNEIRIDAPMRSVEKTYYPTLFSMYEYLNVKKKVGWYATSWYKWTGNSRQKNVFLSFMYFSFLGKQSPSLVDFFRFPILSAIVVFEFTRLLLHAFYLSASGQMSKLTGTFGDFLTRHHYSKRFQNHFLLPFMVNVGTCTHSAMLQYPAKVAVHMISCFRPLFEQVQGGVRNVCEKLLSNVDKVEFKVQVTGAWFNPDTRKVIVLDSKGVRREFDHVVFATQGQIAKMILEAEPPADLKGRVVPPNQKLTKCLSTFGYKPVRVVIHTEKSLMPDDRKDWRGLNITSDGKESMASMWINYVYQLPANVPDYFETNNIFVQPEPMIPKEKVLAEYVFPRSFVTHESCESLDVLERCQGLNGFFFVGSWVWPGMPLLEGCVASSVRVGERLGIQRPWKPQGRECTPWTKEEELLSEGIVDRFLNEDICVEKPQGPLLWRVVKPIALLWIQLYLIIASTLFGLAQRALGSK